MTTLEPPIDELITVLRADRPRPSDDFVARLDARAEAGFPGAWSRPLPSLPFQMRLPRIPRSKLLPALAATTALLIAGAVVVSLDTGGKGEKVLQNDNAVRPRTESPPAGAIGTAKQAAPSDVAPVQPPPIGGGFKPGAQRRVERSASLTLATSPNRVDEVADGVVRVTDRYHGFVLSSNVSSGGEQAATASFELRIPSARLSDALGDLSGLAHVRARNQAGQDITASFVSAQDRLSDLHRERRALLERLAKAGTATEAAAIRAQLRLMRSQIAAARGDLRSLRQRTNYSSVSVSVESDKSSATGGGFTPGDALDDAVRVLGTTAAVILVVLAVALPIALVGLGGWLAGRRLARRRREQALDTA